MKLSIIWILSDQKEQNESTLKLLRNELGDYTEPSQVLAYGTGQQHTMDINVFPDYVRAEWIDRTALVSDNEILTDAQERVTGDYVTQLYSGDQLTAGGLGTACRRIEAQKNCAIAMCHKLFPGLDNKNNPIEAPFATDPQLLHKREYMVMSLKDKYHIYPYYFGGTFVKRELFVEYPLRTQLGLEMERDFFLHICAQEKKVLFLNNVTYTNGKDREGDMTFYPGIYEEAWYRESFTDFWYPFLEEMRETYKQIPAFIQYHAMFTIKSRLDANLNNRNKHVIPEGEEEECLKRIGRLLGYLDDAIINNGAKLPETEVTDSVRWVYGILKYGKDYRFNRFFFKGQPYYGYEDTLFNMVANLRTTISFMNYYDGKLEIDGMVHPILYSMADEVYFMVDNKKYPLQYNGRYGLTKVFGVSIFKNHAFHLTIAEEKLAGRRIFCFAKVKGVPVKIYFGFDSHFSRISHRFKHSYWCFGGKDNKLMMTKDENGLVIGKYTKGKAFRQELGVQMDMVRHHKKKDLVFLLVRNAYFITRPFLKRKPIWLYMDKIYKAGDSSEYLYRYCAAKNKRIKHYYLVDKHTADYKRLRRDGYRPLVRGTIRHRLVFLMADMLVASNSTVFAFNDFGMVNSSYVRDLVDFHVCCVQHGMSVQKIGLAQNRLRDNTRLYFCASEYEIKNLSHPIYDYVGYDALKLTGVPRYDGLVNNDRRQIMISPTWRMQAAVPVKTNEGQQREYNPLFKESTYFRVFNSLINDPRLIDAAKKYGYKIKYVLHPIVSAQVDDFDKNDYVDIIPAVGDMSYEKMFCESSLMVTDYSGIQFDFAYMRKPLVYLHHKDIPQHYEEGTFLYDTMAFGEIAHDNDELIALLTEYMADGCKMKEKYVKRADDFFYFNDRNNCERIYEEMIKYQEKYIHL